MSGVMAEGPGARPFNNGKWRLRAIISDIHANVEALVQVLEDIQREGADQVVCLGDVVGYGPEPLACLDLVQSYCTWSLCGNHDSAVFMNHAVGFNPAAARAVAWHRGVIRPSFLGSPVRVSRWRWLENLPASRIEDGVLYCHASPRDHLIDYVLEEDFQDVGFGPTQKALEHFENFDWLCFVGHSHRPGVATHDLKWVKPRELTNMTYELPMDKKTLVNIGAVGQPRDKNPDACYVLFDGKTVRYKRVPYDVTLTQKKIRAIPDLEARLADRLATGT